MTKDEALRMALDALEKLFGIPDMWTGGNGGDVAVWRLGGSYRTQQAITAIKEALAQPKQEQGEPVAWMSEENDCIFFDKDKPNPMDYDFWTPLYTNLPQHKLFNDPAEYDDYDAAVRRNEGKA